MGKNTSTMTLLLSTPTIFDRMLLITPPIFEGRSTLFESPCAPPSYSFHSTTVLHGDGQPVTQSVERYRDEDGQPVTRKRKSIGSILLEDKRMGDRKLRKLCNLDPSEIQDFERGVRRGL